MKHTEKKFVPSINQKNITVINAKYPPSTTPVAKISFSFQLSGNGDGFTLSFEIVIMVPSTKTGLSILIALILWRYQRDKNSPSFNIAIIKTMNGEKSNFQMRAINMKPNCKRKNGIYRIRSKKIGSKRLNRV